MLCLHSKFCSNKKDIYNYFKYVLIPDEIFFQTILLNSKFKDEIINDNLTYINWEINQRLVLLL
ncbi:beta-1,6-N-acetylglucosaminyltransferase [Bacillus megaterium]|nr:beta-1,6-N-acetylglucosaminyltransferase [Priestia megaterium]